MRIFIVSVLLSSMWANAQAISVEEVVKLAQQKSEALKAFDLSLESLEAEIRARDLLLSPIFTSELAVFRDNRQTLSPTSNRGGKSGLIDVSLLAPFSTGTTLAVNASHDMIGAGSLNTSGDVNVAAWEARISQALWNDAFGRSTRLRRQAEAYELKARRFSVYYQRQLFVLDVESAFWEFLLAKREESITKGNTERGTVLEKWSRGRFSQFAAEATDLLQVQALVSKRRLDEITARNHIESSVARLKELIPGVEPETWQVKESALETDRDALRLVSGKVGAAPMRMDALSANYAAEQAAYEARRVADSLNPTLDLYASYAANGIDAKKSEAWDKAGRAETTRTQVGVIFSTPLDFGLKSDQRRASRLSAESATSRAQGLGRASKIAWQDLQRSIVNLRAQVKEARVLADLQGRKVTSERKRFRQGRTTTLQMTTFELDASESELDLYRLMVDLRKAEGSARLFAGEG